VAAKIILHITVGVSRRFNAVYANHSREDRRDSLERLAYVVVAILSTRLSKTYIDEKRE